MRFSRDPRDLRHRSVRLGARQIERLEALALKRNSTLSEQVRLAVSVWLPLVEQRPASGDEGPV